MPPKSSRTLTETDFQYVLDVCRSAVASNNEIARHHVERFIAYLEGEGEQKKAADLRRLLQRASKSAPLVPSPLKRSRAPIEGEALTKMVKGPVDKETATPLADIIWAEDLPPTAPVLPRELQQLVANFVKEWHHADALEAVGVAPTRSILIYGAPGTGKTHLAMWMAAQLGLPVVVARLDGMISSFLGTTSRNIGSLFDFAERYQCVLLLDEFDAVAKLRDDPHEMGEIKRVVNTILQRLDARRDAGLTIGITNHEQLLDPAVWRRFQVQIRMPSPTLEGRLTIIRRYLAPYQLVAAEESFLGWLCENMTGADIESLIQSFKRLKVITSSDNLPLIELSRLLVDMHPDRVDETQKRVLASLDGTAAKALAATPGVDNDIQSLAVIFGKSRSTLKRWLDS